ncbi:MAG: formimidoylglutamate deiminase [Propionibacteriaceae bacterium]
MSTYWCEQAWVEDRVRPGVRITFGADGTASVIEHRSLRHPDDTVLPGLVLPGLANVHSHAFHRGLRGRTHAGDAGGRGSFWTWREQMYRLAAELDPDSYHRLAVQVYAEMAMAGVTAVGEFHYLHHQPSGRAYEDPNAMGKALAAAATEVGIRLTLLDTCYLRGGLTADGYAELDERQRRFSDGSVAAWSDRHARLRDDLAEQAVVGAAIHSVRALAPDEIEGVASVAEGGPLHLHLSEQPGENEACLAVHGCTPTALLDSVGALGPDTTAVHATHLTDDDIALLGARGVGSCFCPTTERDLADGIGPAAALQRAGSALSLGSDSHAVIDLLEETRAVELHERLVTGVRGHFRPEQLITAMTHNGLQALGRSGGRISVGLPVDLVAVDTDSVRTRGSDPAQLIMTATAADVTDVVVGGRQIVRGGQHPVWEEER